MESKHQDSNRTSQSSSLGAVSEEEEEDQVEDEQDVSSSGPIANVDVLRHVAKLFQVEPGELVFVSVLVISLERE